MQMKPGMSFAATIKGAMKIAAANFADSALPNKIRLRRIPLL